MDSFRQSPVITYDNIALFKSDTPAYSQESNSGNNISFLPLVQNVEFSFDFERTDMGSLGSKVLLDHSNRLAPDIQLVINTFEDFGGLFSTIFSTSGIRDDLDGARNFYGIIRDGAGIGFENYLHQDTDLTIAFGNCYTTNVSVSHDAGGIMSSSYSFVGSNIEAQHLTPLIMGGASGKCPAINMTGNSQEQELDVFFHDIDSYYEGGSDNLMVFGGTQVQIKGADSVSNFLLELDAVQNFNLNIPIDRKTINSLGKKFPVARKPVFPMLGEFSVSSVVSNLSSSEDLSVEDSISNLKSFLSVDEDYAVCIVGTNRANQEFTVTLNKSKLTAHSYSNSIGSDRLTADLSFSFDVASVSIDQAVSLSSNNYRVSQGEEFTISIIAPTVDDGQLIAYEIEGIDAGDVNQPLVGNFVIGDGVGSISFAVNELFEGEKVFKIFLTEAGFPGVETELAIVEKSPQYELSVDDLQVAQGESFTITLSASYTLDAELVGYEILGVSPGVVNQPLLGSFTIVDGSSSIEFTVNELFQGTEDFKLSLTGDNSETSVSVSIVEAPSTYALSTNNTQVSEGDSFQISLETTYVLDGTLVPYEIEGVDAQDIDQPLIGSFNVQGGLASIIFNVINEDLLYDKNFSLTLVGTSTLIYIDFVAAAAQGFAFVVDTSLSGGATPTDSFSLLNALRPPPAVHDFEIDWGDGYSNQISSYTDPNLTHQYGSQGQKTIDISGPIGGFDFENTGTDRNKLVSILNWGQYSVSGDGRGMFYTAVNLTSVPTEGLNTEGLTSFQYGFWKCESLTALPFFDGSKVENWWGAFRDCRTITSVPEYDFSAMTHVEGFRSIFQNCYQLESLPESLGTIPNPVKRCWNAFFNCTSLTSIPYIDFSQAWDFLNVFRGCTSLADISYVPDFSSATRLDEAFSDCALTAQSIENILQGFVNSGQNSLTTSLALGTNADIENWSEIALINFRTLTTPIGQVSSDGYVGRGWTIGYNGTIS